MMSLEWVCCSALGEPRLFVLVLNIHTVDFEFVRNRGVWWDMRHLNNDRKGGNISIV